MCLRRRKLPEKVGDSLTAEQYAEAEELGILVDKDDQARPLACGVPCEAGVPHGWSCPSCAEVRMNISTFFCQCLGT